MPSWSAPIAWTSDNITASMMNEHIRDEANYLPGWKCEACGTNNKHDASFCGELHNTAAGCGRPRDGLSSCHADVKAEHCGLYKVGEDQPEYFILTEDFREGTIAAKEYADTLYEMYSKLP